MHPTIDLYFFDLPVYSALIISGVWLGLLVSYLYLHTRYRRAIYSTTFIDGALVISIAGWIGARAYHVATHWDYYSMRPEEIAQVGLGGLGMRGALMAGLIGLALCARWRGLRLARLADVAAIGLALGQAVGWVGALVHGANYGVVSDSPIAMDLPDIYGLYAPRFPLQLIEAGMFVSLFVGLWLLAARQPRAGTLWVVYLTVAALASFFLGFQRGDEARFIGGWRVDQWVDLGLAGIALVFWFMVRRGEKLG